MRLSTKTLAFVIAMPALGFAQPAQPVFGTMEPPAHAAGEPGPTSVQQQAGAEAESAYGHMGTGEVGASAGLTLASNLRDVNISPMLGYFINDNFEVSGIVSMSNITAGNESATVWSGLVEPSLHFAMNKQMFTFVGVGVGGAYIDTLGAALAVAPRAGFNVLIGKSGVLSPSLSYQYTMHDTMLARGADGTTNVALVAATSALRANIGYTLMW